MTHSPDHLKYALTTHEWVRRESDGTVTIGITDHAQDALGDIVYIELPEVGRHVTAGDAIALAESVKTASDIYAPISGTVLSVNTALNDDPDIVNDSPYQNGWLLTLKPDQDSEIDGLRSAGQYEQSL